MGSSPSTSSLRSTEDVGSQINLNIEGTGEMKTHSQNKFQNSFCLSIICLIFISSGIIYFSLNSLVLFYFIISTTIFFHFVLFLDTSSLSFFLCILPPHSRPTSHQYSFSYSFISHSLFQYHFHY